jgi:leader peptidase (prepilin peptidase) / N-methyltransferase
MFRYGACGDKFQVVVITKCVMTARLFGGDMLIAATAVLTCVLLAIAVVDLRTLRIPDVLSLPLVAGGLVVAWVLPVLPFWHHLWGAAVGFGLMALIGEVYFRRKGTEGLGLGDAKLFGAAGAWLGWQALPVVLLVASVAGLVFAVMQRNRRVAFGPWLALGLWGVWVWARLLN